MSCAGVSLRLNLFCERKIAVNFIGAKQNTNKMAIYTFGKTVSAFITPSRARCTLGMSNDAAVSTPLLATLLCELTSNVLQRKLFDCIKTTTNTSVGSRVVIVDAVIFPLIRLLFRCTQNTNFYRIFFSVSFFPSKRLTNG